MSLTALWSPNNVWDGKTVDTAWYADDKTTFTISTAPELAGLAKLVNDKTSDFKGKTVQLTADLDLANHNWNPIGNTDPDYVDDNAETRHAFDGTFDGGKHTIKNLKVDSSKIVEDYYASGLFGWALNNSEIKDIKIQNASITGHHYVAAVVGYTRGKVSGSSVSKADLLNTHAGDEACGDKTGAIVGLWHEANYNVMTDCYAEDCQISGSRDAGQLIGRGLEANCIDKNTCTANRVSVKHVEKDTCPKANNYIRDALVGRGD